MWKRADSGGFAGLHIDRENWFEIYTAAIGAEVP
jgi:predicted oxidoreductase